MGKAGRVACTFLPMIFTLVSLALIVVVGLGGTNSNNSYLSNIYFMRANTTAATGSDAFIDNPFNADTDDGDKSPSGDIIIENYYSVSLWNYCAGSGDNTTRSILAVGQTVAHEVDFCTHRQLHFWFNPKDVWGISDSTLGGGNNTMAKNVNSMLGWYSSVAAQWISTLYIIAVAATAMEIIIGFTACCSRLGSIFTTISSFISTGFLSSFAILSTITYMGLSSMMNEALFSSFGIRFDVGKTMLIYIWASTAFSIVANILWAFSACCCSGRPNHPPKGLEKSLSIDERPPYTYERVDGPDGQQQTVQVGSRPGSYPPHPRGSA